MRAAAANQGRAVRLVWSSSGTVCCTPESMNFRARPRVPLSVLARDILWTSLARPPPCSCTAPSALVRSTERAPCRAQVLLLKLPPRPRYCAGRRRAIPLLPSLHHTPQYFRTYYSRTHVVTASRHHDFSAIAPPARFGSRPLHPQRTDGCWPVRRRHRGYLTLWRRDNRLLLRQCHRFPRRWRASGPLSGASHGQVSLPRDA